MVELGKLVPNVLKQVILNANIIYLNCMQLSTMLHQRKVQIVFLILICSNSAFGKKLSQLPTCGKTDDSYLGICSKIDNYTHLQDPEPTPVHVRVVVYIEDLLSIDQSAQLAINQSASQTEFLLE